MRGRLSLTPVTLALVGTNLAVFAAMLRYGAGLWHSHDGVQLAWGANFGPATEDGEWWRLATAMFLHFGLVHLAVNMWALWDAGRLVERLYGPIRLLAVYLASGLAGNLLSLIAHGDRAVSGGASGAIFGVYGALLVFLWRERREIHPVEFRWLFGGAAVFSAVTIGFGLALAGIDNAAHIGGLVSGTLVGAALARPLSAGSPVPGSVRWLAGGVFLLAVIALVVAIPAPSYRWREEVQARAEIRAFLGDDARINQRWQRILDTGRREGASFEDLAGRIEAEVTSEYERSFEELSALDLGPAAPSAATVEILRKYAHLRGDAFHSLAEGLRTNDRERIRAALEAARAAANQARGVEPPPDAAR
jgi:rhomboid protease GluP